MYVRMYVWWMLNRRIVVVILQYIKYWFICYTPETNTTLYVDSTLIENKQKKKKKKENPKLKTPPETKNKKEKHSISFMTG